MSAVADLFDDDLDEILTPGMTLMEYNEEAMNLGFYEDMLIYPALGLAGEAGEVANKVAKLMRDKDLIDIDPIVDLDMEDKLEIAHELGDVLWMVTATANDIGFDLDEIAAMNLSKLKDRAKRGNTSRVRRQPLDATGLRYRDQFVP